MGDPIRILHVVVNMNRGGAETLIMNLYRNIDRTKIQFDFLTCKKGIFDSEINDLGGKIYRIPYISEVGHFKFIKELQNFFRKHNDYEIIHSHLDKMSGLVLQMAKKEGIPIRISHSHNTKSEGGVAAKLYKWCVGNLIIPNSTNLVSCSSDAAKWLFKQKYKSSLILKNGIEPEKFNYNQEIRNKVRKELNISKNEFILGHVGRFNHQKNHLFLLDIFSNLNQKFKDASLILVGDGELRPKIERKIKDLKLENKVKLLGVRSDISELLQAFDLFIFPSLHEGLPVSLIEAQGAGVPCLISDHISKEVDLGLKLISYASLKSMNSWVEKIESIHSLNVKRSGLSETIANQGFDIRKTANEIEHYYYSMSR